MFWPLLTLVSDAYPLICPPTSVAAVPKICHWPAPGCWFSITTGLLCAAAAAGSSPIPAAADKNTLPHADQITCPAVIFSPQPLMSNRCAGSHLFVPDERK